MFASYREFGALRAPPVADWNGVGDHKFINFYLQLAATGFKYLQTAWGLKWQMAHGRHRPASHPKSALPHLEPTSMLSQSSAARYPLFGHLPSAIGMALGF
jgi:hypothetical protein